MGILKEVYLCLSPRVPETFKGAIFRLHGLLFGLKQVPRVWFDKFHLTFKKDDFRQISYVSFMFLCRSLTRLTIQVYVKNIMVSVDTKNVTFALEYNK